MKRKFKDIILVLGKYPVAVAYFLYNKLLSHKEIHILSSSETVSKIISDNLSVSRFGDGEMKIIEGSGIGFQDYSSELSNRLCIVLASQKESHLVCVLGVVKGNLDIFRPEAKTWWKSYLLKKRKHWEKTLQEDYVYGDSLFSRFYVDIKDKSECDKSVLLIKQIWDGRDVLIVEGTESRLGVGNDLFDNVASIRRVLCPPRNSFSFYNDILNKVSLFDHSLLVLIALGPTASILAYDLSMLGFQAIDIGHIDIEYEWYLKKVSSKVPVKGKYVNECGTEGGSLQDESYESQIVSIISG